MTKCYSCISLFSYIKPQLVLMSECSELSCISLFSYIKPQLIPVAEYYQGSCISLFSYIKPQLKETLSAPLPVVYLCFPTSNRNYAYLP